MPTKPQTSLGDPTLWYVPIEPFPGRYTESWYHNFPPAFWSHFGSVSVIDGEPLSHEIRVGTFLDMCSTVHYKASQLQTIARLFDAGQIQHGDVFFFGDIEYWGLESIRLMADMCKVRVGITGFLHAASYTRGDAFAIAAPYQRFTEVGWIASLDEVYVGSHYHKCAVSERRLEAVHAHHLIEKVHDTGNPFFVSDYDRIRQELERDTAPRAHRVLFPNRFDSEKNAAASVVLAEQLATEDPSLEILFTTSHATLRSNDASALDLLRGVTDRCPNVKVREGLSKDEYHRLLGTSIAMVSLSLEENFGYCIAESLYYGCIPILPHCASHPEFALPAEDAVIPAYLPIRNKRVLDQSLDNGVLKASVLNVLRNGPVIPTGWTIQSPLLLQSMKAADTIAQRCYALSNNILASTTQ